jgi:hypothetical protein
MPEIPGGCPHGTACFICHGAGDSGDSMSLVSSSAGGETSGGSGYTRRSFYPYGTIYPGFSTWFSVAREVPEVVAVQAAAREVAREAARQQEEWARAAAEQAQARTVARAQAEDLLLRWLSPEQERDYRERQRFDVTGSDGRRWRILCQGQTGNVQLLDDQGEWAVQYCAHPRGLPDPAAWLAQAMAVAHDAASFIRVANVYGTSVRTAENPQAAEPAVVFAEQAWNLGAMLRGIRVGPFR